MIPNLEPKLKDYIDSFNAEDKVVYPTLISNEEAFDYLAPKAPLIDIPDKTIEKTYYYRLWTLRKHWMDTPDGHILSEFRPKVGWSGPYNSINCASGLHIREARWLNDRDKWTKEYIKFWLDRKGNSLTYSSWYAAAVEEYLKLHPDDELESYCIDRLVSLYEDREKTNLHPCGLFYSIDGYDGGEVSISGSGLRPTLNSYMIGCAEALSRMAAHQNRFDISEKFASKAKSLRKKMDELLWDGDFYKVLPCEMKDEITADSRSKVNPDNNVREELGYIPWYFSIPSADKSVAFKFLMDEKGFRAPAGITTAERSHPRFMFEYNHECLWNGPSWPFATSQTLTGLANHLREHGEACITKADYYTLLKQYAGAHKIITDDGREIMWIDEDMDPFTGDWIARTILKADHWNPGRGGVERGKDYNHSTFCDLVLSGLLGIDGHFGTVTVDPIIPDDWNYFCVTNVTEKGLTVIYDRTGEHYGVCPGLHILGGND